MQRQNILTQGENCWRVAHADRVAVLIDAAAYYEALRTSLLKARHSVFIVGWDIDSRTGLVGPSGEADDGLPDRLGPFLTELVDRRPELKIHLLLWDYSMLYALDREPLPSINLAWRTPPQIAVCLDDVLPVGASHHEKIVVIDDAVAFCGGLDLTIRRWDTPAHALADGRRVDPAGEPYRPHHDIQMAVDGAAARALGQLVRDRWRNAACERPIGPAPAGDPWPDGLEADFTDATLGIARTRPAYDGKDELREIEALYRRSIEVARRSIYIECQYLTADSVAECLSRRLAENGDLEVLIVGSNVHHSWLEEQSMSAGRRRFMHSLRKVLDRPERVRLLYPSLPGDPTDEGALVHAKFMVVDDRFLRVGSANLNNRSMGMDTECDLALEARDTAQRERITRIRNRLLAEHLGVEPETVEADLAARGSLLATVNHLSGGPRSLRPIELAEAPGDDLTRTVGQLADPERPIATPTFVGDLFGGTTENGSPFRPFRLLIIAVVILGIVAAWRYTPLADVTHPAEIVRWLEGLGHALWMPTVVPVIFVLGGLVAFPVTILVAVMGMMFSPPAAVAYALSGSLLSAAVIFYIGHLVGRDPLRVLVGPKVNRISRALAHQGILSIVALRMVPIAPFSLINLIAGASHIRATDFLVGTVLGMAPGILVLSFLGRQLGQTLSHPTLAEISLLGLCMVAWLVLCVGLQYIAGRLRARRNG